MVIYIQFNSSTYLIRANHNLFFTEQHQFYFLPNPRTSSLSFLLFLVEFSRQLLKNFRLNLLDNCLQNRTSLLITFFLYPDFFPFSSLFIILALHSFSIFWNLLFPPSISPCFFFLQGLFCARLRCFVVARWFVFVMMFCQACYCCSCCW